MKSTGGSSEWDFDSCGGLEGPGEGDVSEGGGWKGGGGKMSYGAWGLEDSEWRAKLREIYSKFLEPVLIEGRLNDSGGVTQSVFPSIGRSVSLVFVFLLPRPTLFCSFASPQTLPRTRRKQSPTSSSLIIPLRIVHRNRNRNRNRRRWRLALHSKDSSPHLAGRKTSRALQQAPRGEPCRSSRRSGNAEQRGVRL